MIAQRSPSSTQNKYPRALISDLKEQLELFPNSPIDVVKSSKTRRLIGIVFLLMCASILIYLSYNAFKYSKLPTSINEIPLIKADYTPIRVVPNDPGGVQILNQDKLIYNNLQDPSFKYNKRTGAQMEEENNSANINLRSPKQVNKKITPALPVENSKTEVKLKAGTERKKPSSANSNLKNPFEVLEEKN